MSRIYIVISLLIALILKSSTVQAGNLEEYKSQIIRDFLIQDSGLQNHMNFKIESLQVENENDADFVQLKISHKNLGSMNLLMKGPKGFLYKFDQSMKTLLMVTGFFTGKKSVQLLSGVESDTVLVGFEYMINADQVISSPGKIVDFVRKTPAQIAAVLGFLSQQNWVNKNELGVLGVSLGGLFVPSAVRIAQTLNIPIEKTILGYTGGTLGPVLAQALKNQMPKGQSKNIDIFIHNISQIITPYEPIHHFEHLKGKFLILRASNDQVFPLSSSQTIETLLPAPKKIVIIPGQHITESDKDMIEQTRVEILKWF